MDATGPPVHPFGVAGGGRSFFLSAFLGDPPSFVQVKGVLIVIGNFCLFSETVTVSLGSLYAISGSGPSSLACF